MWDEKPIRIDSSITETTIEQQTLDIILGIAHRIGSDRLRFMLRPCHDHRFHEVIEECGEDFDDIEILNRDGVSIVVAKHTINVSGPFRVELEHGKLSAVFKRTFDYSRLIDTCEGCVFYSE